MIIEIKKLFSPWLKLKKEIKTEIKNIALKINCDVLVIKAEK